MSDIILNINIDMVTSLIIKKMNKLDIIKIRHTFIQRYISGPKTTKLKLLITIGVMIWKIGT